MKAAPFPLLMHALITLLVVAVAFAAYDRLVLRPALVVGLVDVAAVYRAKEAQFERMLTQSHSEGERQQKARARRNRL